MNIIKYKFLALIHVEISFVSQILIIKYLGVSDKIDAYFISRNICGIRGTGSLRGPFGFTFSNSLITRYLPLQFSGFKAFFSKLEHHFSGFKAFFSLTSSFFSSFSPPSMLLFL